MPGEVQEHVSKVLDSLNPPPVVEQTRREDGLLEHDPNMQIAGWGFADLPEMALSQGPASAVPVSAPAPDEEVGDD